MGNLEELRIESTSKSPSVYCDPETGNILIKGVSILEDAIEFFVPVKDWLQNYSENRKANAVFTTDLDYFNTSTSRILLQLYRLFLPSDEHQCQIIWTYDVEDWEMKEAGEEYKVLIGEPMILRSKVVSNKADK
jgi:hypothetical protein